MGAGSLQRRLVSDYSRIMHTRFNLPVAKILTEIVPVRRSDLRWEKMPGAIQILGWRRQLNRRIFDFVEVSRCGSLARLGPFLQVWQKCVVKDCRVHFVQSAIKSHL